MLSAMNLQDHVQGRDYLLRPGKIILKRPSAAKEKRLHGGTVSAEGIAARQPARFYPLYLLAIKDLLMGVLLPRPWFQHSRCQRVVAANAGTRVVGVDPGKTTRRPVVDATRRLGSVVARGRCFVRIPGGMQRARRDQPAHCGKGSSSVIPRGDR